MNKTGKVLVQNFNKFGKEYEMNAGFKVAKNNVVYVYGTLINKNFEKNVTTKVSFQYAPKSHEFPNVSKMVQNGEEKELNAKQIIGFSKIIKVMLLQNIVGEKTKDIIFGTDNNEITNFTEEPADVDGIKENCQKNDPSKDEIIKKLKEENSKLKEENNKLKQLLADNCAESEVVVTKEVSTVDIDAVMNNLRKEFDKKLDDLREEFMDKKVTTVVEPPIVKPEEEKPKVLTAEELLETKELGDMSFQELQRLGKYFKIGSDNNSPRPKLIKILENYINPKEDEKSEEDNIPNIEDGKTNVEEKESIENNDSEIATDIENPSEEEVPEIYDFEKIDLDVEDKTEDTKEDAPVVSVNSKAIQNEILARFHKFQ